MSDPLTLYTVGAAVLTEGIKFLYSQAGELLGTRRARRSENNVNASESVSIQRPSELFQGEPVLHNPNMKVAEQLAEELEGLRHDLCGAAEGIFSFDPTNVGLLSRVDALRVALETAYNTQLTFKGEKRHQLTNTSVDSRVRVNEVRGYVAAVRAKSLQGKTITATLDAGKVETGGEAIGLDLT